MPNQHFHIMLLTTPFLISISMLSGPSKPSTIPVHTQPNAVHKGNPKQRIASSQSKQTPEHKHNSKKTHKHHIAGIRNPTWGYYD